MAPDVEELIQKVNSLTMDKNRLRQKLSQLTSAQKQQEQEQQQLQPSPTSSTSSLGNNNQQQYQLCLDKSPTETCEVNPTRVSGRAQKSQPNSTSAHIIGGVECLSSCEDDLLFMNDLFRKRFDEYNENWVMIQSKCSALLSELNALQKHYAILKKEKMEVEANYKSKCDDVDKINCELQTVVLNYETQLSAMSEHLAAITSQVGLDDLS